MQKSASKEKAGLIRKLLYILDKKDKRTIWKLMLTVVLGSFLELLGVTIFLPFINIITDAGSIQRTWYLKRTYDFFGFQSTRNFLIFLSVGIMLVYIVKNVYLILERNYIFKFTYSTQRKLATRLLGTYMKEPYTFFLNKNIAEMQRGLQDDVLRFTQVILYALELSVELVVCLVLGVFLLIVSKSITIIVLGLLVVFVGGFLSLTRRYNCRLGRENQESQGKIIQWMNQALGGIKEIKILERDSFFTDKYEKNYKKYARGLQLSRTLSIFPKYTIEAVAMSGLLLAIVIKLLLGEAEMIYYVPQLTAFAVAAMRLMPSAGRINEYATNMLYALPYVDSIYRDLTEIEGYVEKQDKEVKEEWELHRGIEVKDVTYYYPETEAPVIDGANLSIPKGKTIAFIGTSGAGKTTMVDIILGLLVPQKGVVMADDMNVHEKPKTFHSQVGYIPQTIYLSDDTIRNNIAFGVKEEEVDEEAVRRAMERAQLTEFVSSLPLGLDTYVGDRGVRLSGGQRQRIGIARALYYDPEILVLDEATSALDNDTETAVMGAIENLQGVKTMIIIAHRLTTIRNVDVIYEVEDGRVVEKSKEKVFS